MLENFKQNCFLISGIILCMSATIDPELLELVQGHVNQLSTDLGEMKFENQEEMNNLWLVVKNIHEKLQVEHEKRFEKLERAQDVLQTNQDDLHHEIDAVHQQQSSTAVKVDNLVTNQHDLHHQMNALHQEQCSIAVKVNRLHISQEAFQQRVMELESHSNCGVSYGKYKLDNILPSSFPIFHFHSCSLECVVLLHWAVGAYLSHQTACHNKLVSRRTKIRTRSIFDVVKLNSHRY